MGKLSLPSRATEGICKGNHGPESKRYGGILDRKKKSYVSTSRLERTVANELGNVGLEGVVSQKSGIQHGRLKDWRGEEGLVGMTSDRNKDFPSVKEGDNFG